MSSDTDTPVDDTVFEEPEQAEPSFDDPVPLDEITVGDDGQSPVVQSAPLWTRGYRTALGEYLASRKQRKKRKKLSRKGYVEWYLIDGTFPSPEFVNPDRTGGGVPELKHNGDRYIFPDGAAIPSTQSGMRCYVHKAGEIDPINLRDPVDHAIAPDQFQEYTDMSLQTSSPGWLSGMSMADLLWYSFIGIIIVAIGYGAMNGGLT